MSLYFLKITLHKVIFLNLLKSTFLGFALYFELSDYFDIYIFLFFFLLFAKKKLIPQRF